jgi:N-acetylmuramoyl-L-alanine amidase
MKHLTYLIIFLVIAGILYATISSGAVKNLSSETTNKKIRILIVPGHEPNDGGAIYKGVKERDLNLELSNQIRNILASTTDAEIILARDEDGWNIDLDTYVKNNETQIMDWVFDLKEKMLTKIDSGEMIKINPGMKHNVATSSAVLYLYGTNKWANENRIDLILHVHFNNNPKWNGKPNYRGYCMYVPEKQYNNATSSKIFADYLNEEISKIQYASNMPQEKDLIIESQELIAIGTYDTLNVPSVVVEYAYIYEPMMVDATRRKNFIEKSASSTATAILNYLKK